MGYGAYGSIFEKAKNAVKFLFRPTEQTPLGRLIGIQGRPPRSTGLLETGGRLLGTIGSAGRFGRATGGRMPNGFGFGRSPGFAAGGGSFNLGDITRGFSRLTGGGGSFGLAPAGEEGPRRRRRRGGISARDLRAFLRVARIMRRYAPIAHRTPRRARRFGRR